MLTRPSRPDASTRSHVVEDLRLIRETMEAAGADPDRLLELPAAGCV